MLSVETTDNMCTFMCECTRLIERMRPVAFGRICEPAATFFFSFSMSYTRKVNNLGCGIIEIPRGEKDHVPSQTSSDSTFSWNSEEHRIGRGAKWTPGKKSGIFCRLDALRSAFFGIKTVGVASDINELEMKTITRLAMPKDPWCLNDPHKLNLHPGLLSSWTSARM